MHRAGRSGGCDATLSNAQGRADWGVGAPSPVTLKAGSMGRLWRHPLSCTDQGPSGGWGAATLTLRAGQMGRLWLYPVTQRAGPVGGGGVGALHPVTHRAAGQSGGWGAPPYQAQSRADQRVGVHSPVMNRAGWIGRLWPLLLSHTEPQGDQGVWALPPVTLIPVPGGLAAPPFPVLGGILPFQYIG
uniref:Uncharacterized protein n=1 Tax=Myotis myotis TaxID=51298 RepID=A0A7J7ZYN8_MYOMY|nr:hypothetical protein mMyoMyo1_009866 [Myotis myotis]